MKYNPKYTYTALDAQCTIIFYMHMCCVLLKVSKYRYCMSELGADTVPLI